jgi:hypothetical protein
MNAIQYDPRTDSGGEGIMKPLDIEKLIRVPSVYPSLGYAAYHRMA